MTDKTSEELSLIERQLKKQADQELTNDLAKFRSEIETFSGTAFRRGYLKEVSIPRGLLGRLGEEHAYPTIQAESFLDIFIEHVEKHLRDEYESRHINQFIIRARDFISANEQEANKK